MHELSKPDYIEPSAAEVAELLGGKKIKRKVLGALGHKRTFYLTECPAHPDEGTNLILSDGPNGINFRCNAGCDKLRVRVFVFKALTQIALERQKKQETQKKIVSIARSERIKSSWGAIWHHLKEIKKISLEWINWKLDELAGR